MEQAAILKYLGEVERHVAQGLKHVERQIALIEELKRCGHDTGNAVSFLATLKQTQLSHEQHRDRLVRELRPEDNPVALPQA